MVTPALCRQVESLKEKLISQAQEVSRLRSELVRPPTHPWGGGGDSGGRGSGAQSGLQMWGEGCEPEQPQVG